MPQTRRQVARVFYLLWLPGAMSVASLAAQRSPETGDRVRLSIGPSGQRVVGTLRAQQRDSVSVQISDGRIRAISKESVTSLETSFARGSYGKKGAIIGSVATAALLLGYTVAFAQSSDAPGGVNLLSLAIFSAAGGGVGFLVGSAIHWESWQPAGFSRDLMRAGRTGLFIGVRIGLGLRRR